MHQNANILITGSAGFIASCLAHDLNRLGYTNLILADDFGPESKIANHKTIQCLDKVHRDQLEQYLQDNEPLDFVIHLGARTDTTEMDYRIHERLNLEYSKMIWRYCTAKKIPLIYASSAATYGNGELGYQDDHEIVDQLQPLNPYGVSKNEFDRWALHQDEAPPHWYGLKFFNVYGPNEYHKGRMASVIFHAFHQIKTNGSLKLFRSHHPDYSDGGQMRDFIYVKDILSVIQWLMTHRPANGLYNLGSGKASTFLQLADAIFAAMDLEPNITFIDTPVDIRDKYQYFTEADMSKLMGAGYTQSFTELQQGVKDYVLEYLMKGKQYA
ncbi:MAG: ADP-glyceromanno-heptose 6-epimerase [Chitinophagaceae bacterium]|nr:ADP-glyceromanno-heptose 6-epimerase [Chitinophagaceae bacterium]